jgi:hypothetical protein
MLLPLSFALPIVCAWPLSFAMAAPVRASATGSLKLTRMDDGADLTTPPGVGVADVRRGLASATDATAHAATAIAAILKYLPMGLSSSRLLLTQ